MVGPAPELVGGMARVVEQMLQLDFGARYRLELLPFTLSPGESEPWWSRVRRHLRQGGRLKAAIQAPRTPAAATTSTHQSPPVPIVHLHTCSGFSFYRSCWDLRRARKCGARVVLHVHGGGFEHFHAQASVWGKALIARGLTRADRVIALSESWQTRLRRLAPRARISVVENGVLVSEQRSRQTHATCRFLLLGQMDAAKGVDDLLEACRRLRGKVPFEVTLAGPPGTAGDAVTLKDKVRALGLQEVVRYAGVVRGQEKDELLQQTDIYLQPSHFEGMPLALLEALAAGLPVIATRVGAIPEVITDEREGFLIPSQQPGRLAEAMLRLASDRSKRADFAEAAYGLAGARFSLDRFRDDLLRLYDSLYLPAHAPVRPPRGAAATIRLG